MRDYCGSLSLHYEGTKMAIEDGFWRSSLLGRRSRSSPRTIRTSPSLPPASRGRWYEVEGVDMIRRNDDVMVALAIQERQRKRQKIDLSWRGQMLVRQSRAMRLA